MGGGRRVVFARPEVFDPDYIPETLLYRNAELREISSCIRPALEGRRPCNAKVYGVPATGKTAAVRLLLGQLKDHPRVAPAYVNCRFQSERQAVLSKIHLEVNGHPPGQSTSFHRLCEAVFKRLTREGRSLIAVLDDVNYVRGVSDVLYTLLRAHEAYPGARVSVIAIASSPRFRVPLEARVASSFIAREVYFRPYTRGEIEGILRERAHLGFAPGALSREALEMAVDLAEEHDLRFGIELLRESGEVAEEEGSSRVEGGHVRIASARLHRDGTGGLPRGCEAIFQLLDEREGKCMGEVYRMVREEVGSYSTFKRRVRELERLGRIRAEEVYGRGRTRLLYRL
jgi:cell division control protein 6